MTKRIELVYKRRVSKLSPVGVVCIRQFPCARFSKTIAALFLSGLLVAMPVAVQATTFTGGAITFNDGTTAPSPASPYPGSIVVSSLEPSLSSITLSLTNFTRSARTEDVDMLLVGPTGRTLIVFSDVSASATEPANLILSDAGDGLLPDNGPIIAGTYKPTNYSTTQDTFPAPAPSGPYGSAATAGTDTFFTQFGGTNPNGTWSLYIVDSTPNSGGETGSITGWSLDIVAVPEPSTWGLLIAGIVAFLFFARHRRVQLKGCETNRIGRVAVRGA